MSKMDKQKQIDEMAYTICDMTSKCLDCSRHECKAKDNAMKLYNAGYRKIPENAVVLTREEAEKVYNIVQEHEKVWEDVKELKADFTKEMYALKKDLEKDFEEHEQAVRKETAEKFAERLFDFLDDYALFDKRFLERKIDEICKEITEGKVKD